MIPFEDARQAAFGRSTLSGDNFVALHKACQSVEALEGGVAEIGVGKGGSAKFLMRCLPGKEFDLFDYWVDNDLGYLRQDNPVQFNVRGGFPTCLEEEFTDTPMSLIHLDVDDLSTVLAGLRYYWPVVVVGGVILIQGYEAAKGALDLYRNEDLEDGTYTIETIEAPGSISYLKLTRTAEDAEDEFDFGDEEEEEDEPTITDMRKVEVLRDGAWVMVESLTDVKEGETFHMMEPDEVTFGASMVALSDGYLGENDIPTINCESAIMVGASCSSATEDDGGALAGESAPATEEGLTEEVSEGEVAPVEGETAVAEAIAALDDEEEEEAPAEEETAGETTIEKLAGGKVPLGSDDPGMKSKTGGKRSKKTE